MFKIKKIDPAQIAQVIFVDRSNDTPLFGTKVRWALEVLNKCTENRHAEQSK